MEDNQEFPEIKMDLFGDAGWMILIFVLFLWCDPTMDKETLKKSLKDFQDELEKEKLPNSGAASSFPTAKTK